ncbi:MAG: type II secretion system F family protein [Pseudomonadota bacterium]|nr:type II secretion system F family protein [Pseudomonadota bacterium]
MNSENLILVVGVAMAVAALLLFAQFAYWTLQSRSEKQQRELSRRLGTLVEKNAGPAILRASSAEGKGISGQLEDMIRQAGSPFTLSTLYTRMAVAAIVGMLVLLVAFKSAMGLAGLAAFYLPVMLLSRTATTRSRRLTEQLPDGLDLLARSLQAGHGLSEALRSVAEEMPLPLAQEFGRVYEEHNLGRDLRECLQNLTRRNPGSFDLQIFVGSVLLQRDTGGNLVEILNSISTTIRGRFMFHGKVAALTSEARFTAYILGGLPFFVIGVILLLSPAYLTPLATDPLGHMMLLGCGLSFAFGVFVMREISKVEI